MSETFNPAMTEITEPVILDKTGQAIANRLKTIAEALWAEKVPQEPDKKAVNFYDYDGTRLYSYTKAEFLELTELPANPTIHSDLVAQGWNWDLATAQAYVGKYGLLDIGQMYVTDDGKTRLFVEIGYTEQLKITLLFTMTVDNGVTIDWGDGTIETAETADAKGNVTMSHTYAAEGKYIVTMEVVSGCTVALGQNTKNGTTLVSTGGVAGFFSQGGQRTGSYYGISGRDALKAIEIGTGVTSIGGAAFAYSTNLKLITIPQTCTVIRDIGFFGCVQLESIIIPKGVTAIGQLEFGYNHNSKHICLPQTITTIGTTAFKACTEADRICVPEGITSLAANLFAYMTNAEEIVLPDTIRGAIGNYAFTNCVTLTEINIPDGVTSVGVAAFSRCYNLRKCELPEGVTTIGARAFVSCFGFRDFVVPSTVTSIGSFAFLYNDGYNEFHVKATTPPTLEATAFTNLITPVIYVPYSEDHSILEAYKSATGWSSKADYIVEDGESA